MEMAAQNVSSSRSLSLVKGRTDLPLYTKPIGTLLQEQVAAHGTKTALVSSWQSHRASFRDVYASSTRVARALLDLSVRRGQHIGIFAGNRYEYVDVFLGGGRIGRPVVVLNSMFSPAELCVAVLQSACKVVFIASTVGTKDLKPHMKALSGVLRRKEGVLRSVVVMADTVLNEDGFETYRQFLLRSESIYMTEKGLLREERAVKATDVLNLQFTSGTTGQPKATMLTHMNLLNNGRLNGEAMQLTPADIVCCPPPLFHCFGLVMGFLNALSHGCAIVFPSDSFDAERVIGSLIDEKCTALLSVPTMFLAELDVLKSRSLRLNTVRTGLAAGSIVPKSLMGRIRDEMGIDGMLIAYGMTETSPVTFMTSLSDPEHLREVSLGRVLPHTAAKVIGKDGSIVPRGVRGELCTSGYSLQKGYFNNDAQTREVMIRDADEVLWMHTGDECYIDEDGYCFITGRLKDIIIRGGENIYPREIEERLLQHPNISEASVVGIKDERYGEVIGAFIRAKAGRLTDSEVLGWVRTALGRHKAPQHVFWIGDRGVGDDFPKTASGKHQKHILSQLGLQLKDQQSIKRVDSKL